MYRELYEELEPLGRGSYGTVYKIRCRADDKILVGKEIDFLLLSDREKSQLIAEIIILKVILIWYYFCIFEHVLKYKGAEKSICCELSRSYC